MEHVVKVHSIQSVSMRNWECWVETEIEIEIVWFLNGMQLDRLVGVEGEKKYVVVVSNERRKGLKLR